MRRYFLGLVFVLGFNVYVIAEISESEMTYCKEVEKISGTVMRNRQYGVTMANQMDIAYNSKSDDAKTLLMTLIELAYDEPMWSSESNKDKAVVQFRNDLFKACLKEAKKHKN